jgi:hypothetical protein
MISSHEGEHISQFQSLSPVKSKHNAAVDQSNIGGEQDGNALTSTQSLLLGREDSHATSSDDRTTPDLNNSARSRNLTVDIQSANELASDEEDSGGKGGKGQPVAWRALPRKDQLLVLVLARLSEPLTQNSLGAYIYYQLQSFDPSLPDSTISYQAGVISAAFPAAQCLTAILWGRFSDWEHGGRKRVIWIGLVGTMFSMIGFGFSHNFAMAVVFRSLGGILNGNIGVLRTMISEIIKDKKYQSRAFSIMPITFNIGVIIGPILGE